MSVKIFRVIGKMRQEYSWNKFRIEKLGISAKDVLEEIYSELGSRHKLSRKHIKVDSISVIPPNEVTRQDILSLFKLVKIKTK